MRKTLIGVLVTALLGVATPVAAEEITMICKYEDKTKIYKYVDPLIGKKKILQRVEGEWVAWTCHSEEHHRPPLLNITERGAVMKTVWKFTADKDYKGSKLKKGDEYLDHWRHVLDFEFFTRKTESYMTKMDGSPQVKGKLDLDPDKPKIQNWNCKKYEPNKNKN